MGNNFLANGGTELNATSSLYDLEFRNYDPVLGRMHQVDPMADKYSSLSPYNFAYNIPTMHTDANRADPMPMVDYNIFIETQCQKDAVAKMMRGGYAAENDLSRVYCGGSMTSFLTNGWSVGNESLSYCSNAGGAIASFLNRVLTSSYGCARLGIIHKIQSWEKAKKSKIFKFFRAWF